MHGCRPVLKDLSRILILLNRQEERIGPPPPDWETLLAWGERVLKRYKKHNPNQVINSVTAFGSTRINILKRSTTSSGIPKLLKAPPPLPTALENNKEIAVWGYVMGALPRKYWKYDFFETLFLCISEVKTLNAISMITYKLDPDQGPIYRRATEAEPRTAKY